MGVPFRFKRSQDLSSHKLNRDREICSSQVRKGISCSKHQISVIVVNAAKTIVVSFSEGLSWETDWSYLLQTLVPGVTRQHLLQRSGTKMLKWQIKAAWCAGLQVQVASASHIKYLFNWKSNDFHFMGTFTAMSRSQIIQICWSTAICSHNSLYRTIIHSPVDWIQKQNNPSQVINGRQEGWPNDFLAVGLALYIIQLNVGSTSLNHSTIYTTGWTVTTARTKRMHQTKTKKKLRMLRLP